MTDICVLPIKQRLSNTSLSHKTLVSILQLIKTNVATTQQCALWKVEPQWNTSRIVAKRIEETGLLSRLGDDRRKLFTAETLTLIKYLLGCLKNKKFIENIGIHYELFISETAIAIIYALEYFSPYLSTYKQSKLRKSLGVVADSLWDLILHTPEFNSRTQSRLAWNHSLFVHAVMGLCAIKQPNQHSTLRLERAILWTEGYLSHSLTWDGFSREGVFYAGYSRMPMLIFAMALKNNHNINLLGSSSLKHHGQYLVNEWIPKTCNFISRNDLNHHRHSTTVSALLLHASLLQCSKSLSLWEAVVGRKGDQTFGNPTAETNCNGSLVLNFLFYPVDLAYLPLKEYISTFKVYREAGVVVGFSQNKDGFKYSFQASSHYADIHSHADHGQIYLYLDGDILLTDTAVGNKNESGSPDQSEGHNTLMINGRGMSLAGAGRQTCSILEDANCYGDYHVMRANLTPAYNAYDSRTILAYYKRVVIVHSKAPYHIIVLDSVTNIEKTDKLFTYRFHTYPSNKVQYEQEKISIDAQHSTLEIIPLGINWIPQEPLLFNFNNNIRSNYIDANFSANNFLGGYVLIPSRKKDDLVTITQKKHQIIINTNNKKSCITLQTVQTQDVKTLLSCQTIQNNDSETKKSISVSFSLNNKLNHVDPLTGDIF